MIYSAITESVIALGVNWALFLILIQILITFKRVLSKKRTVSCFFSYWNLFHWNFNLENCFLLVFCLKGSLGVTISFCAFYPFMLNLCFIYCPPNLIACVEHVQHLHISLMFSPSEWRSEFHWKWARDSKAKIL
jgi:hypothetical protein